jgi:hypothetical protein
MARREVERKISPGTRRRPPSSESTAAAPTPRPASPPAPVPSQHDYKPSAHCRGRRLHPGCGRRPPRSRFSKCAASTTQLRRQPCVGQPAGMGEVAAATAYREGRPGVGDVTCRLLRRQRVGSGNRGRWCLDRPPRVNVRRQLATPVADASAPAPAQWWRAPYGCSGRWSATRHRQDADPSPDGPVAMGQHTNPHRPAARPAGLSDVRTVDQRKPAGLSTSGPRTVAPLPVMAMVSANRRQRSDL